MQQPDGNDDDLTRFEADGAAPLPETTKQGYVEHDAARIWHAAYGSGSPVILLHGGLGHSGNWGYQLPALLDSGYRVVVVDSRGHGRSTRDSRPHTYELLASDVVAVMDALRIQQAALVGWSDGACISLILARQLPGRVAEVFFFACNMDLSGVKPFTPTPIIDRCHTILCSKLGDTEAERRLAAAGPADSARRLLAITYKSTRRKPQ